MLRRNLLKAGLSSLVLPFISFKSTFAKEKLADNIDDLPIIQFNTSGDVINFNDLEKHIITVDTFEKYKKYHLDTQGNQFQKFEYGYTTEWKIKVRVVTDPKECDEILRNKWDADKFYIDLWKRKFYHYIKAYTSNTLMLYHHFGTNDKGLFTGEICIGVEYFTAPYDRHLSFYPTPKSVCIKHQPISGRTIS